MKTAFGRLIQEKSGALVIYLLLFIFFMGKVNYYQEYAESFPDEPVHLGYLAYLEKENLIIPDFREMYYSVNVSEIYETTNDIEIQYFTNYLGHPPLYYNLMRLSGGIEVVGDEIFININQLRDFSQLIAYAGLLLAFYIGLTRLNKNIFHLLYGTIIISVPMFAYVSAGINNDALTFLGVTVVGLALLRFSEKKENLFSYILLAIGIFITVLTKLTGGLIVAIACIVYLSYIIINERALRIILNKKFLVTLPVYLVVLAYFIYLIIEYSSIQPRLFQLDPEVFYTTDFYVEPENRIYMTFWEYLKFYVSLFLQTWTGIASYEIHVLRPAQIYSIHRIALFLILILPVFTFFKKSEYLHLKGPYQSTCVGVMVALVYQFVQCYSEYTSVGYLGGHSSRYYLCALPVFAFLTCIAFMERHDYLRKIATKYSVNKKGIDIMVNVCIVFYCILLIYEDFVYFILHFNNFL